MNTQELIPANESIESIEVDQPLPPLNHRQELMLSNIINGYTYTQAYLRAGYESINHADKAAWDLVTKSPIKLYLEKYRIEMRKTITPDYVVTKLIEIANEATNKENVLGLDREIALKAYDQINKIGGFYANPTINVQTVNATVEDIRRAREEYRKDQ